QTYSPLTVVRWVFIFGWLMVLPFGAQQLLNTDFGSMPTYILWDLFFIVFAVTGITYLLNTIALKYVNPSLVSFFVYLQPLVACIHAIRAGKDQLSLTLCIGATLIFTG